MNGFTASAIQARTFSLRILLAAVTLISGGLAFYAFQVNQVRMHDSAIARLEISGARPHVTSSDGRNLTRDQRIKTTFVSLLSAKPAMQVPLVDLTDASLTADVIRKIIPDLQRLIPSELNEAGNPYVALNVCGNPNVSPELIAQLRRELPNCQFVKYSPVPTATHSIIKKGMTQNEVVGTIGQLRYDQQSDWVGDKSNTVKWLGSLNRRYKGPGGLETWTYFTDEIGVGVLGIDFDANRKVAAIWSGRGSRRMRDLTPKVSPTSSNGYGTQ